MPSFRRKIVITAVGFTSIFLAVGINSVLSANNEKIVPVKAQTQYPVVSVSNVMATSEQASMNAYGEVKSRNELTLTSQLSGKITRLSDDFRTGRILKKGTVIANIEAVTYEQELANAKLSLADGRLALAQEELNSLQAAQEWQQSGLANEKPSDLVLRKPQLLAAKARVELAEKTVQRTQYDLDQTQISLPFDALVVSRQVQVGSNVRAGDQLAELYDTRIFEVSLPLSNKQWNLLPTDLNDLKNRSSISVSLAAEDSSMHWEASVDRVESHMDKQSRQRALVVVVKSPLNNETPLFPGTFVTATITGRVVNDLWKLPASALIEGNKVWQVSPEGLLEYLSVQLMFSDGNSIYIKPENPQVQTMVVNRPLSSYMMNMQVSPRIEGEQ